MTPIHREVERHRCVCGSWTSVDIDTGDLICDTSGTVIEPGTGTIESAADIDDWVAGCPFECRDGHPECWELIDGESAAEARAEFAMSWVHGGGHPDDIGAAYAAYDRFFDPVVFRTGDPA